MANDNSIAALIETLGSPNQKTSHAAYLALRDLGAEIVSPALIQSLDDLNRTRRHYVIELLGIFQYKPAVPTLIERLGEPYSDIQVATIALARIAAPKAIDALIGLLHHELDICRKASAHGLGLIKRRAVNAVPTLCRLAESDPSVAVRNEAIYSLARVGGVVALPCLGGLIKRRGSTEFMPQIIKALGELDHPSAIPLLYELAHDPLFRREAVEALNWLLEHADWEPLLHAQAVQNFVQAAEDDDVRVRAHAVQMIGRWHDQSAIPILARGLGDTREIPDFSYLQHFVIEEGDRGKAVRRRRICDDAAEALRAIGTPEALAALETFRREQQ